MISLDIGLGPPKLVAICKSTSPSIQSGRAAI
jgi:hypothetical protein